MRPWLLAPFLAVTACPERAAPPPASPKAPAFAAGLAERVRDRLKQAAPDATVTIVDPSLVRAKVGDWQVEVGLDNVRLRCTTEEACETAIANSVTNFKTLYATKSADAGTEVFDHSKILLALKDAEWLAHLDQVLRERPDKYQDNTLLLEPWAGTLSVVLVLDQPTGMRLLQHGDLAHLGLTEPQVRALARRNLSAAFPKLTPMEELSGSGVWTNTEDENYASALLVLPELWAPLAKQVDGKLVVAVPARNRLFATGDQSPRRLEVLQKVVAQAVQEEDHPLVTTLFEWSPQGFKVRKER